MCGAAGDGVMGRYIAEAYLARVRDAELVDRAQRARAAADALTLEASAAVRHLRTIFLPGDEVCFLLFEGPSEAAVAEAARRAEIAFERVVAAEVREATSAGEKI
jgi:hypothetical protein